MVKVSQASRIINLNSSLYLTRLKLAQKLQVIFLKKNYTARYKKALPIKVRLSYQQHENQCPTSKGTIAHENTK